jgi:phage baseplate assembly protein W
MSTATSDYNQGGQPLQVAVPVDRQYVDLSLGLNIHPVKKDLTPLTDIDAVKNSVRNIVLTNFGDRPFHPEIGGQVTSYLFEHINELTALTLKEEILKVIAQFEPRVNRVRVNVTAPPDDNRVVVTILFNIISIADDVQVEFYLERIR